MRFCQFDGYRLGLVDGSVVRDVTAALEVLPASRYPGPRHDALMANLALVAARACELQEQAPAIPLAAVRLLSPVANPGKIVAAPVNYQRHLAEVKADRQIHHDNPAHTASIDTIGLFLKATSSLVGAGEGIALRMPERRTDHEVELAVVIGRTADRVRAAGALEYVAGYAIGLDITMRGSEDRSFRKSPDSYTVLGPWLVTADEIPDPGVLDLEIAVNGERRQSSNTRYLIKDVAALIEMASAFYTLHPGDILLTGTPEGVGPIEPADVIVATIEGIGSMTVAVQSASSGDSRAMEISAARPA